MERIKPVTPSVVRFARWFLSAGWSLDVTAELFDVDPVALQEVV